MSRCLMAEFSPCNIFQDNLYPVFLTDVLIQHIYRHGHLIYIICLFGWVPRQIHSSCKMNTLDADISANPYCYTDSTTATPLLDGATDNHIVLEERRDTSKSSRMGCNDSLRETTPGVLPLLRTEARESLTDIRCSAETNGSIVEVLIGEEPARKTSRVKIPRVLSLGDASTPVSEVCPPYCSNPGHKHLPSVPSPLRNCETVSERSPVREPPQRAGWIGATWCQITSWTKILWSPILGHKKGPSNNGEVPKTSRKVFGKKPGVIQARRSSFSGLASTYDGSSRENRIATSTRPRSRSRRSLPGSKEYIRASANRRYKGPTRIANFSTYYMLDVYPIIFLSVSSIVHSH
jgi:hypothetical protein